MLRKCWILLLAFSLVVLLVPAQVTVAEAMNLSDAGGSSLKTQPSTGTGGNGLVTGAVSMFFVSAMLNGYYDLKNFFTPGIAASHNGLCTLFANFFGLMASACLGDSDSPGAGGSGSSGGSGGSSGSSGSGGSGGSGSSGGSGGKDRGDSPPDPLDFRVVPEYAKIQVGETVSFRAELIDTGDWPSVLPLKWSASGGRIDKYGRFTADQPGTYTVTATSYGKKIKAKVVVTAPPELESIRVLPEYAEIQAGETISFRAELLGSDGKPPTGIPIEWSASGGHINQDGTFTADEPGTYTVTATALDKSATAQVAVASPLESIHVTPQSIVMNAGGFVTFRAELVGSDGKPLTGIPVEWSASGGRIGQDGTFTADEPGTYTVTATALGKSATAQVTVITYRPAPTPKPTPPELKLKPLPDRQDDEGDSVSFTVELTNPAVQNVEFSMSGAPNGVQIDPNTGEVSGTIAYDNVTELEMMKTFNVVVTARETGGLKRVATEEFTWTIGPEFKLQPLLDLQNGEGDSISFTVKLTNSAITPNVQFSMSGAPNGVQIDPNTGQVSGTIAPDNVDEENEPMSEFHVVVTARETGGLKRVVTEEFTWRIGPEFKLKALPDRYNNEGDSVSFTVELTNPNVKFVEFSLLRAPEGVQIDPDTGEVSWTIGYDTVPDPNLRLIEFKVVVRATETEGLKRVSEEKFHWVIYDKSQS